MDAYDHCRWNIVSIIAVAHAALTDCSDTNYSLSGLTVTLSWVIAALFTVAGQVVHLFHAYRTLSLKLSSTTDAHGPGINGV